eukprot:m.101191 g.101191  ORF g.101191 m.101191 type:complete len:253 (-) comp8778_c0_seq5:325-1083(-)
MEDPFSRAIQLGFDALYEQLVLKTRETRPDPVGDSSASLGGERESNGSSPMAEQAASDGDDGGSGPEEQPSSPVSHASPAPSSDIHMSGKRKNSAAPPRSHESLELPSKPAPPKRQKSTQPTTTTFAGQCTKICSSGGRCTFSALQEGLCGIHLRHRQRMARGAGTVQNAGSAVPYVFAEITEVLVSKRTRIRSLAIDRAFINLDALRQMPRCVPPPRASPSVLLLRNLRACGVPTAPVRSLPCIRQFLIPV